MPISCELALASLRAGFVSAKVICTQLPYANQESFQIKRFTKSFYPYIVIIKASFMCCQALFSRFPLGSNGSEIYSALLY